MGIKRTMWKLVKMGVLAALLGFSIQPLSAQAAPAAATTQSVACETIFDGRTLQMPRDQYLFTYAGHFLRSYPLYLVWIAPIGSMEYHDSYGNGIQAYRQRAGRSKRVLSQCDRGFRNARLDGEQEAVHNTGKSFLCLLRNKDCCLAKPLIC